MTEARLSRWVSALPAVSFVAAITALVQSYVVVKLAFLAVFLVASLTRMVLANRLVVYPRLVWFFLTMAAAGIAGALVGLMHAGNGSQGALEGVRVYAIWSVAFVVLFSALRCTTSLALIHAAMVAAAIIICVMNLVGLADAFLGWGLVTDAAREELYLTFGINDDGLLRINSVNIGSLFVLLPYLLSVQFRADAGKADSVLTKVALVLSILVAALSGRRALWLIVALTPFVILLFGALTNSLDLLRRRWRRALTAYCLAGALGFVAMPLAPERTREVSVVRHVRSAFASSDERSIQVNYLLDGFAESPVWGSGFGAYAGYLRNDERPWIYELVYVQMLYNLGLVGMTVLVGLFVIYLRHVVALLRRFRDGSAIPFALLVGIVSLLMGAYTNPYVRSFDFLFLVGFLPFLATFEDGFRPRVVGELTR